MGVQGADFDNVTWLKRDGASLAPPLAETALPSLAGREVAARFCAWRGASDRRYIASVYPVESGSPDFGCPDFEEFVLVVVGRGALGRRILDVCPIERDSDRRAAVALGRAGGADEWHVLLLAEDRRERAELVADLSARHGATETSRCA